MFLLWLVCDGSAKETLQPIKLLEVWGVRDRKPGKPRLYFQSMPSWAISLAESSGSDGIEIDIGGEMCVEVMRFAEVMIIFVLVARNYDMGLDRNVFNRKVGQGIWTRWDRNAIVIQKKSEDKEERIDKRWYRGGKR